MQLWVPGEEDSAPEVAALIEAEAEVEIGVVVTEVEMSVGEDTRRLEEADSSIPLRAMIPATNIILVNRNSFWARKCSKKEDLLIFLL